MPTSHTHINLIEFSDRVSAILDFRSHPQFTESSKELPQKADSLNIRLIFKQAISIKNAHG